MAVGEQAGQGLADEIALADDDPADLGFDRLRPLGEGFGGETLVGRGGVGGGLGVHPVLRVVVAVGARDGVRGDGPDQWVGSSELK